MSARDSASGSASASGRTTERVSERAPGCATDGGVRGSAQADAHGALVCAGEASTDAREPSRLPKPSAHYLYVVECADGTLYTGYATDVKRRVEAHNAAKGAMYTLSRLPVVLRAYAGFESKHDALSAEFRFKRLSRGEKLELIERCSADEDGQAAFSAALRALFAKES